MILDIINQIAATAKRKEKEKILEDNKDNLLLKRCFEYAGSPRIKFNMKKLPEAAMLETSITLEQALDEVHQKLVVEQKRGGIATQIMAVLLGKLNDRDAEVLSRVVKRNLKCGVKTSLVNKTWPELIPEQPGMYASAYNLKLIKAMFERGECFADLKADGARAFGVVQNGKAEFFSRNGSQYKGLKKIETWLSSGHFDGFVIDGEMIYVTDELQDRSTGNGIVNKSIKGTISNDEQMHVVFQVWDLIPIEVYFGTDMTMNAEYWMRKSMLQDTLGKMFFGEKNPCIQMIPSNKVDCLEEAVNIYHDYVSKGLEGIILKDPFALWEDARSKFLVKFKTEYLADLEIIDYKKGESDGKHANTLGAIKVRSADGLLECWVGTGLSDKERDRLYALGDDMLGLIAEIKYNMKIKARDSELWSLYLSRYQRIRDDKDVANTIDNMQ